MLGEAGICSYRMVRDEASNRDRTAREKSVLSPSIKKKKCALSLVQFPKLAWI